jgi:hypothetical protein
MVVEVVEVVEDVVEVVVPPHGGHVSGTSWPTALCKQMSASVAVVGSEPFGAHTQAGRQT